MSDLLCEPHVLPPPPSVFSSLHSPSKLNPFYFLLPGILVRKQDGEFMKKKERKNSSNSVVLLEHSLSRSLGDTWQEGRNYKRDVKGSLRFLEEGLQ